MNTKKAYVVGTQVRKSLSPIIFQYWFDKYNIDGKYTYRQIDEASFDKDIRSILREENLCGFNVTIPYKEKILPYLTNIDTHSSKIGAVNCVTKTEKSLKGINTDWIGFNDSISNAKLLNPKANQLTKKNEAIVIGYGGAAKAIIYSLQHRGFKKIKVFNRTFNKIKKSNNVYPHKLKEILQNLKSADLIINTIPYKILSRFIKKQEIADFINSKTIACDIVYNKKWIEKGDFLNTRQSRVLGNGLVLILK